MKCPPDNHNWERYTQPETNANVIVCTICATLGFMHYFGGGLFVHEDLTKPITEFAGSINKRKAE